MAFVVLAAVNRLGIDTTSFAIIAAAGLAVGFALQGSLSNFAAGVRLILFKPFKETRRVDLVIGCGYADDLRAVKQYLEHS